MDGQEEGWLSEKDATFGKRGASYKAANSTSLRADTPDMHGRRSAMRQLAICVRLAPSFRMLRRTTMNAGSRHCEFLIDCGFERANEVVSTSGVRVMRGIPWPTRTPAMSAPLHDSDAALMEQALDIAE